MKQKQCQTCGFVTHLEHPNGHIEWWHCTYRAPATMRVLDVDSPLQIGDEPLRAKICSDEVRVTPDDWCDEWKERVGPEANLRHDGVFKRYGPNGIAQPMTDHPIPAT